MDCNISPDAFNVDSQEQSLYLRYRGLAERCNMFTSDGGHVRQNYH